MRQELRKRSRISGMHKGGRKRETFIGKQKGGTKRSSEIEGACDG